QSELHALRVDVDDGRQAGAAHGRGGGGEELSGARAHSPWLVRFRDQLRAVASTQAKERRGPQQVSVAETVTKLFERTLHQCWLGAGDNDANDVLVRRVTELPPPLELPGEKAPNVVARGELDRA